MAAPSYGFHNDYYRSRYRVLEERLIALIEQEKKKNLDLEVEPIPTFSRFQRLYDK
jgi:hypothetical protein